MTERVKQIDQPWGGYVRRRDMDEIPMVEELVGSEGEQIEFDGFSGGLVGSAVDYLFRLRLGLSPEEAFHIPLVGMERFGSANHVNLGKTRDRLLAEVDDPQLGDDSVAAALCLAGYDVWARTDGVGYDPRFPERADEYTIADVREMVNRCVCFDERFLRITDTGLYFPGGYTEIVSSGDADYMNPFCLLDLKTATRPPQKDATLQLLMYFIMARHSIILEPKYEWLTTIGIFNPRLNRAWFKDVWELGSDLIRFIEEEVLGYEDDFIDVEELRELSTVEED